MDPLIGTIMMVGFNFAPRGWAHCDGQLLAIAQNQALFSLLGTTYGGDGRTTFGLPDLRGRFPLHPGNGPGLPSYRWGQKGGSHSISQAPAHSHTATLHGETADATERDPKGNLLAGPAAGNEIYAPPVANDNRTFAPESVVVNSSGPASVEVQNPYLGCYFIIALQGTFPSRN